MSAAHAESNARRRIVLHCDDVGMCHGTNRAFLELSRSGTCSSGSVMVPCPWFPEIAMTASGDPSLDLGVHLTLNSEMHGYKWRPLTAPSSANGLTDEFGYFWPDVASTRRLAARDAVSAELTAQVEAAISANIDVTHLDAHMGAALAPEFCDIYLDLASRYRLPVLLTASLSAYAPNDNLVGADPDAFRAHVESAKAAGFEIFGAALQTTWSRTASDPAGPAYKALLTGARDPLTFVCLHLNAPGEIEHIDPSSSRQRVEEYELFRDETFRLWLTEQPFEIIGMRVLRDELRARVGRP